MLGKKATLEFSPQVLPGKRLAVLQTDSHSYAEHVIMLAPIYPQ